MGNLKLSSGLMGSSFHSTVNNYLVNLAYTGFFVPANIQNHWTAALQDAHCFHIQAQKCIQCLCRLSFFISERIGNHCQASFCKSVEIICSISLQLLFSSTLSGRRLYRDGVLKLLGRLSLLSEDILLLANGLPNPFCSSDHLCLLASFGLEISSLGEG